MGKIKPEFQENVSETLLIPLYMRAQESKEENPIIVDTKSVELLSKVDYDFSKFSADERCQRYISLRTKYFDEAVRKFVDKYDDAVVVLIACGLDPRVECISIEKEYQVYELDLPDVINLRKKFLPESSNNRYIAGSITNDEWIQTIKASHPYGHFLFILEGISMYLTEEEMKNVFKNIDDNFDHAEVHVERMNKFFSKRTYLQKSVNNTNATFNWGCDNPKEIEQWCESFKLKDEYYYSDGQKNDLEKKESDAAKSKFVNIFSRSLGIWSYEKDKKYLRLCC
ncbi:MAG: class I SAM-dependent methyltransferase [Paludibacteraceae bacterium]|nr:class I SAM-dependent methyltransferase [Paludibacteraceae bacterium]